MVPQLADPHSSLVVQVKRGRTLILNYMKSAAATHPETIRTP